MKNLNNILAQIIIDYKIRKKNDRKIKLLLKLGLKNLKKLVSFSRNYLKLYQNDFYNHIYLIIIKFFEFQNLQT